MGPWGLGAFGPWGRGSATIRWPKLGSELDAESLVGCVWVLCGLWVHLQTKTLRVGMSTVLSTGCRKRKAGPLVLLCTLWTDKRFFKCQAMPSYAKLCQAMPSYAKVSWSQKHSCSPRMQGLGVEVSLASEPGTFDDLGCSAQLSSAVSFLWNGQV